MKTFLAKSTTMLLFLAILSFPAFAQQKLSPTSSTIGRYQIFFSPTTRADTFLVDTLTGRVWRMTTFTDIEDNPSVWLNMDRIDDDKALSNYVREHKSSSTTKSSQ